MKSLKTYIVYGFALLFLIGLLVLFSGLFIEGKFADITKKPFDQPNEQFQDFSNSLWNSWGLTIVIVAVIIFSSGTSILVLLRES